MSSGGTSYTTPPTVVVTGGGGAGVTAQAVLNDERVDHVVILNAGTGFTSDPTISFTGGGGSGAAATAVAHTGSFRPVTFIKNRYNEVYGIDGMGRGFRWDGKAATVEAVGLGEPGAGPALTAATTDSQDFIKHIELVDGGSGYSAEPTVTITGGTPSTPATARAFIENGAIQKIDVVEIGSGYQEEPSVVISGGRGSSAAFTVNVVGKVKRVNIEDSGSGYVVNATTAPAIEFSTAQGLTDANAIVTVDEHGRIDYVEFLSAGTGATTTGVTAVITGGSGSGATVSVDMDFSVSSVTISNAGSGYFSDPKIEFLEDTEDALVEPASATLGTNSTGEITSVNIVNGGSYIKPPTAVIKENHAKATATLGQRMRGKYYCAIRYIDDTPEDEQGPVPSSISELIKIDTGDAAGLLEWNLTHYNIDDRVHAVELWRTSANQDLILYRVATIERTDRNFSGTYTDTLDDETLIDGTRDGFGLMPVTMPSGQVNARRFNLPPAEMAVAVSFQDRSWFAVDVTGKRPNSLMFSEVDEFESVPSTNEMVLQENAGESDIITALVPLSTQLLVVQQSHLYTLSYVNQPILDAVLSLASYRGILNSRCWAVLGGVAFIADSFGIYAFEGSSETAVSVPVDYFWRDDVIDFSKSDKFHMQADLATRVIRFFYCTDSDTYPSQALCYSTATKAWWQEEYAEPVSAGCRSLIGGKLTQIFCNNAGAFKKFAGLTDSGTAISWRMKTGNFPLQTDNQSRAIDFIYNPTSGDESLNLALAYNGSASARENAITTNRGSGFTTTQGSTSAVLNLSSTRSELGDATGQARAYYSGHADVRSVGADKHVAIDISGQQSTDSIVIHTINLEGAG